MSICTACVQTAPHLNPGVPALKDVLPMIPAGATYKDVIYEDPKEHGIKTLKAGEGL